MEKEKTRRVAIIEDDDEVCRILADVVKHTRGHELVGAWHDAESAIEKLPALAPDVVVTDINLPGINGVDCIRSLSEQLPDARFLVLTVYQDADLIFSAFEAGATGYLLKPVKAEELVDAISAVAGGGAPMTSDIALKVVMSFRKKDKPGSHQFDLAPREKEVLDLLAQGYLYKEIADQLEISFHTVNHCVERIFRKLQVRSRSEAVAKYIGYLPPEI
jgi:DNA-binding NarL/FixJ family response regulator